MAFQNWCLTEYSSDIFEYLLAKEKERFLFRENSPQIHLRSSLINLISEISVRKRLNNPVKHLAIYLLDTFMDNHSITEHQLRLVALGCLLIAAKLEEADFLIPKASELNGYVNNYYQLRDFIKVEMLILNFFKWRMIVPTAAHFVEYFVAVSNANISSGRESYSPEGLVSIADYFLEVSIKDMKFLNILPSLIGSACVGAARHCMRLPPSWLEVIEAARIHCSEMRQVVNMLLKVMRSEQRFVPGRSMHNSDSSN